jgi:hypothetical protein
LPTLPVEHQPDDPGLSQLGADMDLVEGRTPVVLSDLDLTLVDEYGFDPATNNHLPQITPELVDAAQDQHLIINTTRRANHPSILVLWRSGLVSIDRPIIAEGGGTLVFHDEGEEDGVRYVDLVPPDVRDSIHASRDVIADNLGELPHGQELVFKIGRTTLLTRLQTPEGTINPIYQQWLAAEIRRLIANPLIEVVDNRNSVSIRPAGVNKGSGFRTYLDMTGMNRDDLFVFGLGDSDGDEELFKEADYRIGFSEDVLPIVDIHVPEGPSAAPSVLRMIKDGVTRQISAMAP